MAGNHSASSARALLAGAAVAVALAGSAWADPGVSADRVLFGQSAPTDGPAAALGTSMRDGLLAAFAEVNANGGVAGRRIQLVTRDDGYEPNRAIANTQKLIADDKVFALIGAVGTPTAQAAQPVAAEAGVPFIGPFTGAGFLRNPKLANVVNFRASYDQETEAWIERLTADLGYSRIAILYQDDGFGRAGLSGVRKAMERRNLKLVAEANYPRNTTAIKTALLKIRKARPQAVVMVGAYKPCAEFIKLARKIGTNPTFVNISFVGSNALAKELGPAGAGVVISQVVPFPADAALPVTERYRKALAQAVPGAEPGFVSFEGYLVGRMAVEALGRVKGEPTRQVLLAAFYEGGAFDLGGIELTFGAGDNQGSDQVFLTVIQPDGTFKPVTRLGPKS